MATTTGKTDRIMVDIAQYLLRPNPGSVAARKMARYCLMDALGCALHALDAPECLKLLGPVVEGVQVMHGARVPGTAFELDPVTAAFNIGTMVRWHDFNDTWWSGAHPSDNFGGLLAIADWLSRRRIAAGKKPLLVKDLVAALIQAYEIQGVLTDGNMVNVPGIGLDPIIFVKIASAGVVTHMLGGGREEILSALSNAVIDGHALTIYRTKGNAGPRKSWAAADASARAIWLALIAMRGEMGYPQAFSAKTWGFDDVLYHGKPLVVPQPYGSYVMENIEFKIAYPAQRHTQTAAEGAVLLHPLVKDRIDQIERIELHTHQLAASMVCRSGTLTNFAARDHCMQYIIAIGLLDGDITPESYNDARAADARIDVLREKVKISVDARYTKGFESFSTRSNSNALQIVFKDGSKTPKKEFIYPIGDRRRRKEGMPLLEKKFQNNLARCFPAHRQQRIAALFADQRKLDAMPVNEFVEAFLV